MVRIRFNMKFHLESALYQLTSHPRRPAPSRSSQNRCPPNGWRVSPPEGEAGGQALQKVMHGGQARQKVKHGGQALLTQTLTAGAPHWLGIDMVVWIPLRLEPSISTPES